MSKIMRHVGQDHLGHKLVVIFRELPEDTEHCLVVESNTLPDMYHDNLMNVVESQEAQQTVNLYEVLNRRVFGDGQHMLNALHNRGLLRKMSVDQVSLIPMPNRKLSLREANQAIAGTAPVKQPEQQSAPVAEEPQASTAPVESREQTPEEKNKAQAQNLLTQARLLEADAKKYREQAYALDPALKAGGRPAKKKTASKSKSGSKKSSAKAKADIKE